MATIKTIGRAQTRETDLLQFCWKHKMGTDRGSTEDGKEVEVIDTGLQNYRTEAPDFFNAKLRINGTLWVGNVVVTDKASDWYLRGWNKKSAYDSVVLAVVRQADTSITNSQGQHIKTMEVELPQGLTEQYERLMTDKGKTLCHQWARENCTRLCTNAWFASLQTERLEWQQQEVQRRAKESGNQWETAYFVTLVRAFGMGINGDLMEQWARSLPMHVVGYHADDLFQLEALFLGQAGLLELDTIPEKFQHDALNEGYFAKLRNEYLYLAHKYTLQPLDGTQWKPTGSGHGRTPHLAFDYLANMYHQRKTSLQEILSRKTLRELHCLLRVTATPYWQMHHHFGAMGKKSDKPLTAEKINHIIINAVVPALYAYGHAKSEEIYCDRAFDIIEQCKAERNDITKQWEKHGFSIEGAGDSQAIIQLQREYCDKHKCLRCRFGYEYLRQHIKVQPEAQPQAKVQDPIKVQPMTHLKKTTAIQLDLFAAI